MGNRSNALAVMAVSVLLVLGDVLPAQATVGTFEYTNPGPIRTIHDFSGNLCHTYVHGSGHAWNKTNASVKIFSTNGCSGIPVGEMGPHSNKRVDFHSIQFVNRPTSGRFQYTEPGTVATLHNPRSNICVTISGDGYTYNGTNKTVEIFHRNDCLGTANHFLRKRQHSDFLMFESVKFIR
ncbi:hypothetical protein AB0I22_27235 [Streptomyces sp. NPDC050610]|uniref:hypothetical protein n=1 Tax=Streptomyces sp. NPDC050610 TaxID=3157097 RepID=UPI003443AAED